MQGASALSEGGAVGAPNESSGWRARCRRCYDEFGSTGLALLCFSIPIKLSWAYTAMALLLIGWLCRSREERRTDLALARPYLAPLWIFLITAFVTGAAGFNPLTTSTSLFTLMLGSMLTFLSAGIVSRKGLGPPIAGFLTGQTLVALHSILDGLFPDRVGIFFPGKVTESGQLALMVPLVIAVLVWLSDRRLRVVRQLAYPWSPEVRSSFVVRIGGLASALLVFLGVFAFWNPHAPAGLAAMCLAFAGLLLAVGLYRGLKVRGMTPRDPLGYHDLLAGFVLPVLLAAFLVNLKRGPWAGVLVASGCFLAFHRPRWALVTVAGVVAACVALEPIRDRVLQSASHFFISGGRSEIWSIGWELSQRYPLGIGYKNSYVVREFSTAIPPELRHFHSNFLNVLVETGWLGLAAFCWWVWRLCSCAFARGERQDRRILVNGLGACFLASQIAGLVEYNFGDSEVAMMSFVLAGVLAAVRFSNVPELESVRLVGAVEPENALLR